MIINIPLQIDETAIEGQLSKDYEHKIIEYLSKEVNNYILSECNWRNHASLNDGIRELVNRNIRNLLEDNKDAIIAAAGQVLAEKLARYKQAKELIPELAEAMAETKSHLSNEELIDILGKQNLEGIEE